VNRSASWPHPEGFHRTVTGLWLPDSLTQGENLAKVDLQSDHWITTIGYSDLHQALVGRPGVVSISDVVRRLRPYTLEQVIRFLARIAAAISRESTKERRRTVQLEVSRRIFGSRAERLWAAAEKAEGLGYRPDHVVMFHERQLLSLAKVAFLVLPADSEQHPVGSDDVDSLAEALLMINDLIDGDLNHSKNASGDTWSADATSAASARRRELALYSFANTLFNQQGDAINDLARTELLYFRRHPTLSTTPEAVDIPEMIERATGMSPFEAWAGLYLLFVFWFSRGMKEADDNEFFFNRHTVFHLLDFTVEEQARIWSLGGRTAAELQAQIRGSFTVEDLRWWDVLAFEQSPLVYFENRAYCLSPSLLQRLASESVQHRLLDRARFCDKERQLFLNYRGRLFEDYVTALLRRVYGDRLFDEAALRQVLHPGERTCDAVITYGSAVIVVECKAALVPLIARQALDIESFEAYLRRTYVEAADQLSDSIARIQVGRYREMGLDPGNITRYYPVVVTMDLTIDEMTYRQIAESDLIEHRLTTLPQTAPFQSLDVGELESIETAAAHGRSWRELLEAKTADDRTCRISFNNFCFERGERFAGAHNPYLAEHYEACTARVMAYLRSRGKPGWRADPEPEG